MRSPLRMVRDTADVAAAAATATDRQPQPGLSIPAWHNAPALGVLTWSGFLDPETMPPTRAEAMAVPAMARARHVLCGMIARAPLTVLRGADPVDPAPSWPARTDQTSSPFHRMLWTVDDLLFYGASLWRRDNGFDGFPVSADRIPYELWDVNPDGHVVDADGQPFDARDVIYIPGPHEGVLTFAARAIRQATSLERAAAETARTPFRAELHQTSDDPLTAEERAQLVADARAAVREHGGVVYTNRHLELKMHTTDAGALLVEGRNAAAVDMARAASVPAAIVDATTAGASLTYETTQGRNAELVDYGLSLYLAAVESRLSLDDVVPRGQRTAFDVSSLIGPAPLATGPARED